MPWLVYLLRCADGSLYTGVTNDLPRRVAAHNAGTAAKYTRSRRPVRVVHTERARGRSAALRREYAIKRLTRARKLELIRGKRPEDRRSHRVPVSHRGHREHRENK